MNDLISVIMPVYNGEKFLKKSIESLINQTYIALEILLINDGSTDSSLEICERYASIDKRIKVISKTNGGQYSARNLGLRYAKGKYIGFLDQDDYLDITFYEKLIVLIKKYNANIARANNYFLQNGKLIIREKKTQKEVYYPQQEFVSKLLSDEIWSHVTDRLFESSIIKNLQFPKSKTIEDMGFMRFLVEAKDVSEIYTLEPLFIYNNRLDNTSHLAAKGYINSYERAIEFQKRYKIAILKEIKTSDDILKQAIFFTCSSLMKMRYKKSLAGERDRLKTFLKDNMKQIKQLSNLDIKIKIVLLIYKYL